MASSEARRICLRMTLVILNIPIMIIGAGALAVGLWVILDDSSFFDLIRDVLDLDILGRDILRQSSLIMVTAGAALIVLAGIGVMGALALSSCLLVFVSMGHGISYTRNLIKRFFYEVPISSVGPNVV
ncbi:tetraspanin [Plakobranchus ocellatus]|uniref:Tetraspanin n=1 Tax=Plakobranchus ocellatus TaxID=259542 RepID=A0AAV4B7S7_9GAST|nr:tetraspanin [Plakobranchus ocellatus]